MRCELLSCQTWTNALFFSLQEYFTKNVGPIRKVLLSYDKNGRSLGVATIIFAQPNHAAQAAREYDGIEVDKRPMKVSVCRNSCCRAGANTQVQRSKLFSEPNSHLHRSSQRVLVSASANQERKPQSPSLSPSLPPQHPRPQPTEPPRAQDVVAATRRVALAAPSPSRSRSLTQR